jgi:hypothetical protein
MVGVKLSYIDSYRKIPEDDGDNNEYTISEPGNVIARMYRHLTTIMFLIIPSQLERRMKEEP